MIFAIVLHWNIYGVQIGLVIGGLCSVTSYSLILILTDWNQIIMEIGHREAKNMLSLVEKAEEFEKEKFSIMKSLDQEDF